MVKIENLALVFIHISLVNSCSYPVSTKGTSHCSYRRKCAKIISLVTLGNIFIRKAKNMAAC